MIPGMEPTGHYWFNLGKFLQDSGMRPVHVNPHHVKKSKEMDDNNPNKNDRKDPKTIAALVNEGRFSYPYIPTGIYAEPVKPAVSNPGRNHTHPKPDRTVDQHLLS